MASSNELDNKVVSSNEIGNVVGNVSDKVDNVSNEVDNISNKVDNIANKVGNVANKVGNISNKDDKVGSSNKDKEDSKKVDNKDKPKKISINKKIINLLNTKPKPPKAKFRVKNAIEAKFRPNIEYTASIAIEAENGSVEDIVIAKNANSKWN